MQKSLDSKSHAQIEKLCKSGDKFAEIEQYENAIEQFKNALKLVPEPKNHWEASTWIYVAIGDIRFCQKCYNKAEKSYGNAIMCPDGLGNPYIHLRLGQTAFELNNLKQSTDELTRAYMGAGDEIFEDDEPKYLNFLKTKIEI